MKRLFFIIFASLLNFAASNAYNGTMSLDGLTRDGSDVIATFSVYYEGSVNGSLYFQDYNINQAKTNEYDGKILVFGTDGTQYITSCFCQGTRELNYGAKTEIPEGVKIKFTLRIFNVPKTDSKLAAVFVKALIVGENGFDPEDGKSAMFTLCWNASNTSKELEIH